ncbi:TPA: hypothetical protein ACQYBU_004586 [Vibrio parahaemolyticus]
MKVYDTFKDKIFLCFFIPALVALIWSITSISYDAFGNYHFVLFPNSTEWDAFMSLYKVPISIGAFIVGLIAIFTSLQRMDLMNQQQRTAEKLNEFNMSFKLREEFNNKFESILTQWIKKSGENNHFRLENFQPGFDIKNFQHKQVSEESLVKNTNVQLIRLYDFAFGKGRSVFLSKEFVNFLDEALEALGEESGAVFDDDKKSKFNEFVNDKFIKGGQLTIASNLLDSHNFSTNEKFHLSLSCVRLAIEISCFAGEVKECGALTRLTNDGQSIEHNLFYGPNLILGELDQSKAFISGNFPRTTSSLMKQKS